MRGMFRLCGVIVLMSACARASGDGTERIPGAPLADLTDAEMAAFTAGRALFEREFTESDGLGPSFNERRCSSCHDLPASGGSGAEIVPKATRYIDGRCDLLRDAGGDMLQQSVTDEAHARGLAPERIPARATAAVNMTAPSLLGSGLLEAIPEEQIRSNEDPDDADEDGVSGRIGIDAQGRLGRFGHKANFSSIRQFIANALLGEMGLTSRAHPLEESMGGQSWPTGIDRAADPEIDDASIELLTTFVTLLAAPSPEAGATSATRDSIRDGERYFDRAGCAQCHTPSFRTRSDTPALNVREVRPYTDLLLHDMGAERATVCSANASPSEWRTPALAGLRYRNKLLHDGSAQNLHAAIEAHGGEGARSRAAFRRLSPEQQALLLRFLSSL